MRPQCRLQAAPMDLSSRAYTSMKEIRLLIAKIIKVGGTWCIIRLPKMAHPEAVTMANQPGTASPTNA
jgi:hypothetical protein